MTHPRATRVPLLAAAMLSLIAASLGGLARLGWSLPGAALPLSLVHGPLMVGAFLGTVIGLERAVGLDRRWALSAPILSGAAGVSMLAGGPQAWTALLLAGAGIALVVLFGVVTLRHRTLFNGVMAAGAVAWAVGNVLWLAGWPVFQLVLWWAAFLILTIAGERLELNRFLRPSRWGRASFVGAAVLLVAGLVTSLTFPAVGAVFAGAGLVGLAGWLLHFDIARRTVRQPGLTRFIALCLLSGYGWLCGAGLLLMFHGALYPGPMYDAILHMIFLGFVFAMIFGHAPIIFPAILNLRMTFRHRFYLHLVLLHASLALRVLGDLAGWGSLRQWGGLLNAVALLIFLLNTVASVQAARRPSSPRSGVPSPAVSEGRGLGTSTV